jgi:hypothetical protein
MMTEYTLTDPAVAAFVWIAVALSAALGTGTVFGWRRSGAGWSQTWRAATLTILAAAAWMILTWRLAASGILQRWDTVPPPFGLMVGGMVALAVLIAVGPVGTRIARHVPLWILIAVQGFRLPLELAMHAMYERGIMPVQMSYSGGNFDIVTGASALVVAALVYTGRGGRRLAMSWNVAGLLLLLNVVIIAMISMPVFAAFGEDRVNVWVTYTPFVWLPAVMVLAALAGHLIIFRALRVKSAWRG